MRTNFECVSDWEIDNFQKRFNDFLKEMKIGKLKLAFHIGVSRVTIYNWANMKSRMPIWAYRAIRDLVVQSQASIPMSIYFDYFHYESSEHS